MIYVGSDSWPLHQYQVWDPSLEAPNPHFSSWHSWSSYTNTGFTYPVSKWEQGWLLAQRTAVKIPAILHVKLLARSRLKEVFSQQPQLSDVTIMIRFPKERHWTMGEAMRHRPSWFEPSGLWGRATSSGKEPSDSGVKFSQSKCS